ncbi:MAG: hypothetical protein AB1646_25305 [Thermodesulfobacteriota bacterium]
MIQAVTDHIVTRLSGMKLYVGGQVRPLKVFPPGPHREQGITEFPSVAVSLVDMQVDTAKARPHEEVFTPSAEQIEAEIAHSLGGGTMTGPDTFLITKYPTPVRLLYQVDLRATKPAHMTPMLGMVLEALPVGYQPRIGDKWVLFDLLEAKNLDELAKPQFWTAFRYWVHDVWIERFGSYEVGSITDIDFPMEA